MTAPSSTSAPAPVRDRSLQQRQMPKALPLVIAGASWGGAALLLAALGAFTALRVIVLGWVLFLVAFSIAGYVTEGRRKGTDRLVTTIVFSTFAIAMTPLVWLVAAVVIRGWERLDATFFTSDMRNVVGEGGGALHAIIGTLYATGFATLMSVPVGIMCAIFLIEYGQPKALAKAVTFLVDVMTGIPSIVAGLFIFSVVSIFFGPGYRSAFAGALALSVLMIPTVIRSTEEMLKIVPNELREASYALGVSRWRTITRVVLPTALAGIATGVTLAIARVIGETAPLLIVMGTTDSINSNPFDGRMASLPVFSYYQYVAPGVPPQFGYDRAWTAALVLMVIALGLNFAARIISRRFSPTPS